MEEGTALSGLPPPPTTLEPISRPSSTSTSASASLQQLPGISALAQANSTTSSPQLRYVISQARADGGADIASCTLQTLCALNRDYSCARARTRACAYDSTRARASAHADSLCADAAAYLCFSGGHYRRRIHFWHSHLPKLPNLHNAFMAPRRIWLGSLQRLRFIPQITRTCTPNNDVIKSRNRVKTMRPDLAKKKQQQQQAANFAGADPNGMDLNNAARRKSANGNIDGSDSPVSRTATPSLYNPSLPVFGNMDDSQLGFNVGGENRSASPLNGDRHLDVPQTHEQLIAANSALKTRVSELELINELFRGRLSQMEQDEASARRGQEISGKAEAQLRSQLEASNKQLEDSHRRENNLKRRLDEMELELKEAKEAADSSSESGRAAKKLRVADMVGDSEVSTPQSTTA
ncbi:GATA type zinc finger protein asd-4 [Colletotrichum aenigma]|uniref:GATA type zinc finger protein asd-4 n=1 Tax=Colletotrichum aenigma TaxID=1215731 RepID=UPI001872D995|nr:GATA type zinc finger protein asd-4 [Colletotrichum aenigma]KAF5522867.1 GATA type zinc finger protein asd-4 [Colletotrichum aenigma]